MKFLIWLGLLAQPHVPNVRVYYPVFDYQFRPPMGKNILCSGHSYVWGPGVDGSETWCAKIGGINDGHPATRIPETFNYFKDYTLTKVTPKIQILAVIERDQYFIEYKDVTFENYLAKFKKLNRKKGSRFIALYLPSPWLKRVKTYDLHDRLLKAGVKVIDLSKEPITFDQTGHPDVAGHALIAKKLKEVL